MSYLTLYILINVFCIAFVAVIAFHARIGMGSTVARHLFTAVLAALAIFYASDTIWYAIDCNALPQVLPLSMFLKSVYFLAATAAGYAWFLYMGALTKFAFIASRTWTLIASALVWVHLVLLIVNLFTPILFGIDENFTYFRGPAFGVQYLFCYYYLVMASGLAIYRALQPENHLDRTRYVVMSLFPVLPAISGILQLFFWRVPFNCVAFTMAVLIVYLTELGQQVSQEPLTQLSNRKQFIRTLEQNMDAHKYDGSLYLFMLDIDRFKSINDTFGHIEGDQAIVAVGDALRNAANGLRKRAVLSRFGGDEFAVVALLDSSSEAREFRRAIQREIAEIDLGSGKDYRLEASIGIAQYEPAMASYKDLIAAADANLYREKQAKSGTAASPSAESTLA